MSVAIQVDRLSKLYRIGGPQENHQHLRDALASAVVRPIRRVGKLLRGDATGAADLEETIWALRDVSLEVKQGEVVGIIGRNGAGKTTLLKILSRITEPTDGRAEIHGRVGSLLEVGTGFHQELTGRENVYLNGAILGMRREEIERKFDEIVAFAEIEKFIDTPIKHYSSGMYVRLAFAVAAHLEPEILLVDEVLAVGDVRFQKKCLQKMEDVGQAGRTVLFVSHNMPSITRLCGRAILLEEGRIIEEGPTHGVVSAYLTSDLATKAARRWEDPSEAPGSRVVLLQSVRVVGEGGEVTEVVNVRDLVSVEMEYEVLEPGHMFLPHFHFDNEEGVRAFISIDNDPEWRRRCRPPGRYRSTVRIPGDLLADGMLYVSPVMITLNPVILHFHERNAVAFQVVDNLDGHSARVDWAGPMRGVVRPLLEWRTEFEPRRREVGVGSKGGER